MSHCLSSREGLHKCTLGKEWELVPLRILMRNRLKSKSSRPGACPEFGADPSSCITTAVVVSGQICILIFNASEFRHRPLLLSRPCKTPTTRINAGVLG